MAPLLVLLVTGLCDLGFAAYDAMEVQAAAEAGAQYAALNGWDPTAIATVVTSATGASGITATPAPSQFCACAVSGTLTNVSCASTCADGTTPGTYVQVNAQLQFSTILPYPALPQPLTLTGQALRRM